MNTKQAFTSQKTMIASLIAVGITGLATGLSFIPASSYGLNGNITPSLKSVTVQSADHPDAPASINHTPVDAPVATPAKPAPSPAPATGGAEPAAPAAPAPVTVVNVVQTKQTSNGVSSTDPNVHYYDVRCTYYYSDGSNSGPTYHQGRVKEAQITPCPATYE